MNYDRGGPYSNDYTSRFNDPDDNPNVPCPHCKGTGLIPGNKLYKTASPKEDYDDRSRWGSFEKGPLSLNTQEPLYYRRNDAEVQPNNVSEFSRNEFGRNDHQSPTNWFIDRNPNNTRREDYFDDEESDHWNQDRNEEPNEPNSWDNDGFSGPGMSGGDGYFEREPFPREMRPQAKLTRKQRRRLMRSQRIDNRPGRRFDGPPPAATAAAAAVAASGREELDYSDFPPVPQPEQDMPNERKMGPPRDFVPPEAPMQRDGQRQSIPPLMSEQVGPGAPPKKRSGPGPDFSQNQARGRRQRVRKRRNQQMNRNQQRVPPGPRPGGGDALPRNMPSVEGLSEMDIFSLGVLYANYLN